MNVNKINLQKQINRLKKEIESEEENNDGTLEWVDNIRDLHIRINNLENQLMEVTK